MPNALEYKVFIDESGVFRSADRPPEEEPFSSQIVGILVGTDFSDDNAERLLAEAFRAAGLTLEREVHARDLKQKRPSGYSPMVADLAQRLTRNGVCCLRLVNRESVAWSDRPSTYVNMVAQLILRCFETLKKEGHESILLHLHAANWWMPEVGEVLAAEKYRAAIHDALALALLRSGLDARERRWRLGEVTLGDARTDRRLQLCDVLSHASSADYRPCNDAARASLQEAFGANDTSLGVPAVVEDLDRMIERCWFGQAMARLAEASCVPQLGASTREAAGRRRASVASGLAGAAPGIRDDQLRGALAWLHELIDGQRVLKLCRAIASDFRQTLDATAVFLPDARRAELSWVRYAVNSLELVCANHQGDIDAAVLLRAEMESGLPQVAGSWEHAPLIIGSMIHLAVYENDIFEHEAAAKALSSVIGYFDGLDGLFHAVYPELFPAVQRSDQRARALGTAVQTETARILGGVGDIEAARALSDRALVEFDRDDDVRRQHQYRAHLEAAASCHAAARQHLAIGVGASHAEHGAIAVRIREIEGHPQGFALLHWLRLGVMAAVENEGNCHDFLEALTASRLLELPWCTREPADYPSHGILRRVAVIQALLGERRAAAGTLKRLCRSDEVAAQRLTLVPIQLAGMLEVAAAVAHRDAKLAQRILVESPGGSLSAVSYAERYLDAVGRVAGLVSRFGGWPEAIRTAAAEDDPNVVASMLWGLARVVPH